MYVKRNQAILIGFCWTQFIFCRRALVVKSKVKNGNSEKKTCEREKWSEIFDLKKTRPEWKQCSNYSPSTSSKRWLSLKYISAFSAASTCAFLRTLMAVERGVTNFLLLFTFTKFKHARLTFEAWKMGNILIKQKLHKNNFSSSPWRNFFRTIPSRFVISL